MNKLLGIVFGLMLISFGSVAAAASEKCWVFPNKNMTCCIENNLLGSYHCFPTHP